MANGFGGTLDGKKGHLKVAKKIAKSRIAILDGKRSRCKQDDRHKIVALAFSSSTFLTFWHS